MSKSNMTKGCSSCNRTYGDPACKTCPYYPDFWVDIDPCFGDLLRSDHAFYSKFVPYTLATYGYELR